MKKRMAYMPSSGKSYFSFCKILVVCALAFLAFSCLEEEDEDQVIEKIYTEKMKPEADSVLLSADPATGFAALAKKYAKMPEVKQAEATESSLFVEYENGELVGWVLSTPAHDGGSFGLYSKHTPLLPENELGLINEQPYLLSTEVARNNVDGKKVCIVDLVNDPIRYPNVPQVITYVTNHCNAMGWGVKPFVKGVSINGGDAILDFFNKGMSDYNAIFLMTHGACQPVHSEDILRPEGFIWLCTGIPGSEYVKYKNKYKGLSKISTDATRNGELQSIEYIWISEVFFNNSENQFPSSFIYLCACQGLKFSNLAASFIKKGAKAVTGWTDINCVSPSAGAWLFANLLQCKSVYEIFVMDGFPRTDNCAVNYGYSNVTAEFAGYPSSVGDFRFCESNANVTFSSYVEGDASCRAFFKGATIRVLIGDRLNNLTQIASFIEGTRTTVSIKKGTYWIKIEVDREGSGVTVEFDIKEDVHIPIELACRSGISSKSLDANSFSIRADRLDGYGTMK